MGSNASNNGLIKISKAKIKMVHNVHSANLKLSAKNVNSSLLNESVDMQPEPYCLQEPSAASTLQPE